MDVDRGSAKATAKDIDGDDPEYKQSLSEASHMRVTLEREGNRHKEEMAKGERGSIGNFLGGERNAPLTIAFLAVSVGSLVWIAALIAAYMFPDDADFWAVQGNRALALALTALGYVFGKSAK